eukprot:3033897-Amphidinium_carterae.4
MKENSLRINENAVLRVGDYHCPALFTVGCNALRLGEQFEMLCSILHGERHSQIHMNMDESHRTIESGLAHPHTHQRMGPGHASKDRLRS